MDDEKQVARGDLAQEKKDWEALLSNRAWGKLIATLQTQTDSLQQELLFGQIRAQEDAYRIERLRGRIESNLGVSALVQTMLEEVGYDLSQLNK